MSEWLRSQFACLNFPSRIVMWLSKMARIYITDISGLSHCNTPPKLVTSRINSFRLLCVKLGYRYGGRLNVPLISSDKSCSSTSGNKTEKKTLKEIMESCQDLDILIVACTIVCVLQILCLCLLRKTRNIPSSRLYGDTHDLIRKPARILNGKKMDRVQWQVSRNNPSNMANNHFNQVGFMTIIIEFDHQVFLFSIKLISHACELF